MYQNYKEYKNLESFILTFTNNMIAYDPLDREFNNEEVEEYITKTADLVQIIEEMPKIYGPNMQAPLSEANLSSLKRDYFESDR